MAEEKARDPTKQEMKPVNIPLSKIHDLPGSVFAPPSQKSLEALTSSIVLKGVQEPVILRQREDGEFQIVSGNRRRKASEFAKKTEIPAFVYDMGEREAKEFRFRNKGEGTPPGKLLPESEIGKKREAPEKAPDKSADGKTPDAPLKAPEKPAGVKPAPTPEPKKPEEKPKAAAPTEKADAGGRKPDTSPKPLEKPVEVKSAPATEPKKPEEKPKVAPPAEKADAVDKKPDAPPKPSEKPAKVKTAPAPEPKKPEEKPKAVPSLENEDADGKKTDISPKTLEKPAEIKSTPTPEQKKPEDTPKTAPSPEKADAAGKKPDAPPKPPEKPTEVKPTPASAPQKPLEKPAAVKPAPAFMPGPAALGPSGTKITKIFDERLMPPDEKAMKDLPVPKDGESYFITLHPAYLEKSEFNTVSVDVTSDDYKELKKSIELNGVKDPVLTRLNPKGGLEILSGQRRHMIARELNYPVPAIIQKIDDNDAMILVADSNLHRPHISTYDLSRTLRNKMTAMKRKAGRKKRGEPSADELNSDEMLAKEMGISTSKLNRIIRLSEASKEVCEAVDSNSLELSIASALSFLKPENQTAVIDLMGLNLKPTVKRVQRLRDAEKSGKLDDKTMRDILEDKDLQPVKPPEPLKNEPPKPEPTQTAPPFPVASMVTPSTPTPPAQTANTPPATSTQTPPAQPIHTTPVTSAPPAPPEMKPVIQEPPKQEPAPQPPVMQAAEKPDTAPEPASNGIPLNADEKKQDEPKTAADEEPIEHNSQRDNMYATKVTLGGDRLRRYFPDVTMAPMQIVESIYSALEDRRQREARAKQKTEILHPGKPVPTR